MQMIADLADRIHVLDYGRTIAEGAPNVVLADPNVLSAYLGTADIISAQTPVGA
jgi:branched-chain amino acid transport system ATP-binding protein